MGSLSFLRLFAGKINSDTHFYNARTGKSTRTGGLLAGLGGTSQEDEVAIGRQIAGNLLGAAPLVKDKRLQKYVNNVGRWVASQSERPDLPWHFGVIESNDINAFAAPGGYIFLTRGLSRLLGSEAELAGVLAHEVGHVIRKHHLKILQQSRLIDLGGKLADGPEAGKAAPAAPEAAVTPPTELRERHLCDACGQAWLVAYESRPDEPRKLAPVACPHCWQVGRVEIGAWAAAGGDYRAEKA